MSALEQDVETIRSKQNINVSQQLVSAARESGRSPIRLTLDFMKLKRKRGKLRFYEYFLYKLYDQDRWS